MKAICAPVDPWLDRMSPRETTKAPHPDDGADQCTECEGWDDDSHPDSEVHECPGFECDCDAALCGVCLPWGTGTIDDSDYCHECLARAKQAELDFKAGMRTEPIIYSADSKCEECDGSSHMGAICRECEQAFCPSCFYVGSDGMARCENCAKAKVGL